MLWDGGHCRKKDICGRFAHLLFTFKDKRFSTSMTATTDQGKRKTGHRFVFLLQVLLCPHISWGLSSSVIRFAAFHWIPLPNKTNDAIAPMNGHCHQQKFTVQSIGVCRVAGGVENVSNPSAKLQKPALSNESRDKRTPYNATRKAVYIVKLVSRFLLTSSSFTTVSFCLFLFFIGND